MTKKKTPVAPAKKEETFIFLGPQIPKLDLGRRPYLKFEELDQKQKEFYRFLVNNMCGVNGKIHPKTGVGSLCSYLRDLLESKGMVDSYTIELYDYLAGHWDDEKDR